MGAEADKLFAHDDDKKKAAPVVKKLTKQEIENAKIVKQQKAMLEKQKAAMKHSAKHEADENEVRKLFKQDDDKKKKAAPVVKKPTKQEIENAKIVKQQKAMLEKQKAAMKHS